MEHRVEVMPETSTKHTNDRLNLISKILLSLFGIVIGVLAVTAAYEISLQLGGFGSQNLSKSRAIRALNPSETDDDSRLTLCRSQLKTANTKLQAEKGALEAIKANLTTCDAEALKEGRSSESKSLEILNGTLQICLAEKDDLEEEKDTLEEENSSKRKALEIFNVRLQMCRDEKDALKKEKDDLEEEKDALEEEKTSSETRFTECLATASKCDSGWSYLKETDSCYYHQGFTKDAQGEVVKYRWKNAEDNCVYWGGHLVSIHSKEEFEFVHGLIQTDIKSSNEDATESNACAGSEFYAWNGLHFVNGRRKWSDGTPDDYIGQDRLRNILYYMMCNDISNDRPTNSLYFSTEPGKVEARFVCKKDANE